MYYATAGTAWPAVSDWWDTFLFAAIVFPLCFSLPLLALPLYQAPWPWLTAAVCVLAASTLAFELAELELLANGAKFSAFILAGWLILTAFDNSTWVIAASMLAIPVDILSVTRGPTGRILDENPEAFSWLSVSFPASGEGGAAIQLGLPDIVFFSLFLAAAARFGLRIRLTWFAMVTSLAVLLVVAFAFDTDTLPVLPFLSIAFLAANADTLLRSK